MLIFLLIVGAVAQCKHRLGTPNPPVTCALGTDCVLSVTANSQYVDDNAITNTTWLFALPGSNSYADVSTLGVPTNVTLSGRTSSLQFFAGPALEGYRFRVSMTNCRGSRTSGRFTKVCKAELGLAVPRYASGFTSSRLQVIALDGVTPVNMTSFGYAGFNTTGSTVTWFGKPSAPTAPAFTEHTDLSSDPFVVSLSAAGLESYHGTSFWSKVQNCAGTSQGNTFRLCHTNESAVPVIESDVNPKVIDLDALDGQLITLTANASAFPVTAYSDWYYATTTQFRGLPYRDCVSCVETERQGHGSAMQVTANAATMAGWGFRMRFCNCAGCGSYSSITRMCTASLGTTPPAFSEPAAPTNYSVPSGQRERMSAATLSPLSGAQWQYRRVGDSTWRSHRDGQQINVGAGTASALSRKSTGYYEYRALFDNCAGRSISPSFVVCYGNIPSSFSSSVPSVTVAAGSNAVFMARPRKSNPPILSLTWQVSTDSGATWSDFWTDDAHDPDSSVAYLNFTAQASDNGNLYRARWANCIGNYTTKSASLCTGSLPVVTAHPQNATVFDGDNVTFTVETDTGIIPNVTIVRWQVARQAFPSPPTSWSTLSTRDWPQTTVAPGVYRLRFTRNYDRRYFRAVVESCLGSVVSEPALLCQGKAPVVRYPTSNLLLKGGTGASIQLRSYLTTSNQRPRINSVVWEENDGDSWAPVVLASVDYNISGSLTDTRLNVRSTAARNGYRYRASFYSCLSNVTTVANMTLCAGDAPTVIVHPVGTNITNGAGAVFSAEAVGIPNVTRSYWQYSTGGSFRDLRTSASYVVTSSPEVTTLTLVGNVATNSEAYRWRAVFESCLGSSFRAYSTPARLCSGEIPYIRQQPVDAQTLPSPQVATFSAKARVARSRPYIFEAGWQEFQSGVGWVNLQDGSGGDTVTASNFITGGDVTTTLSFAASRSRMLRAFFRTCVGTRFSEESNFTLCVGAAPVIDVNLPSAVTQGSGAVVLAANATASPEFSNVKWEWFRAGTSSWATISTGDRSRRITTSPLGLNNVDTQVRFNTGSYYHDSRFRVTFANCFGTTTSQEVTMCSGTISYSRSLRSATVTDGISVTLFATRRSNEQPPITAASWEVSGDRGVTWSDLVSNATYTVSGDTAPFQNMTLSFVTEFPTENVRFRIRYDTCLGLRYTGVSTLRVTCVSSQQPTVLTSPVDQEVNDGATVSLTATAERLMSGAPLREMRWEVSSDLGRSWTTVDGLYTVSTSAGLENSTLSWTANLLQDGYQYRAVFKNCWRTASFTSAASLRVVCTSSVCPPRIAVQPKFQTLRAGGVATFSAAAEVGTPAVSSSVWELSTDGGATWVDILDVAPLNETLTITSPTLEETTLSFPSQPEFNGYLVRVIFSNSAGSTATLSAFLAIECVNYGCGLNEAVCETPEDCGPGVTDCGCKCTGCPTCVQAQNPVFSKQCSANIVLVLDESGSIGCCTSKVRAGLTQFVQSFAQTSLVGGTANLGVVEFSNRARLVTAGGNAGRMAPLNQDWAGHLYNYTYAIGGTSSSQFRPGGCTNWGEALQVTYETAWTTYAERTDEWVVTLPDIIMFFTDGAPTVHPGVCNQHCNAARTRETPPNRLIGACAGYDLGPGCYYADLIKQRGTKVFLVGIGGVARYVENVRLVSGNLEWDSSPNSFPSADYMLNDDYDVLGVMFLNVVKGLCTCFQNAPSCESDGVSGNCLARSWSARTRVTTTATTSSTFAKNSVQAMNVHYNYIPTPDTRIGYEFFGTTDAVDSFFPTVIRTDIQDPCKVRRVVRCGNACFTVSERQDIPRFFREKNDVLGATNATYLAPSAADCLGWTKFYDPVVYPVLNPVMTKNLWTLLDGVTPCAAEAFDGTFYEFFEANGATRGVDGLGSEPDFDFDQADNCTLPKCARDVELVFVVDEQASISFDTFAAMKAFVNKTIESFDLDSDGVLFGITWTSPDSDATPEPSVLSGTTLATPNMQSNVVSVHVQNRGSADFAARGKFAVEKYWPTSRAPTGIPRQLVFVVGGPDSGTDPNRFAELQALCRARNIEYWAIGIGAGANEVAVLEGLSEANTTSAHYFTFADVDFLLQTAEEVASQFCPQGNLCGSSCSGFCGCNTPQTCECPTCTSSTCFTRSCPSPQSGCSGPERFCDDGSVCTSDKCVDPVGCVFEPSLNCDDSNNCTVDSCLPTSGCQNIPVVCSSADPCVLSSCDPLTGDCITTPVVCDDNSLCTTDQCVNGTCTYTPIQCSADSCTLTSCNETTGLCEFEPIVCDDGNLCTTDSCSDGTCFYVPVPCPTADLCFPSSCDALSGVCVTTNITCDDGDACTTDDCVAGECVYTPVQCQDGNPCTRDFCALNGTCVFEDIVCDDGDNCTLDSCVGGTCRYEPVSCPTADECFPRSCDALTGTCRTDPVICDDGLNCTADSCASGVCSYTPIDCSTGFACLVGACEESLGGNCSVTPLSCTTDDPCLDVVCDNVTGCVFTPIPVSACDDGNDCTVDSCVSGSGCLSVPIPGCTQCSVDPVCDLSPNACERQYCLEDEADCATIADDETACLAVIQNASLPLNRRKYCFKVDESVARCGESTACVARSCNVTSGECIETDTVCNDGNECTIDSCNVTLGGCVYRQRTQDEINQVCGPQSCQNATCITECVITNITEGVCSDNPCVRNPCSTYINTFCERTVCINQAVGCESLPTQALRDACVLNVTGGSSTVERYCYDQTLTPCPSDTMCTTYTCNAAGAGSCDVTDIGALCPVTDMCLRATCDSVTGCGLTNKSAFAIAALCNDDNDCTIDSCVAGACVYTPVDGCSACTLAPLCDSDPNLCQEQRCAADASQCSLADDEAACLDAVNNMTAPFSARKYCYNVDVTEQRCGNSTICVSRSCDSATGLCVEDPLVCDDGSACTSDACNVTAGGCVYTPLVDCGESDACVQRSCDAVSGQCVTNALNCTGDDPCVLYGCNTTTGCFNSPVPCPESTACIAYQCRDGQCVGEETNCDDSDPCTIDSCNVTAGGCVNAPINCGARDTLCETFTCVNGACVSSAVNCNDNNPCTVDSCNVTTGCVNEFVDCGTSDACVTRSCDPVSGLCTSVDTVCNSGDLCIPSRCDNVTGCVLEPIDCGVSNACVQRQCVGGVCEETLTSCDDGNNCTIDSCDAVTGCQYETRDCSVQDSTCTKFVCDALGGGACVPEDVACDDGNPCTIDSCQEGVGCVYEPYVCPESSDCFDIACVGDDGRGGPLCNTTTALDCNDQNSCTIDSCIEGIGCVHLPYKCLPTSECNFPVNCSGTGPEPECSYMNITSLFDFCGVCKGDNAACFFSSVTSVGQIAGITAGAVAGITVAVIIGVLIAMYLSKKGFDYYKANSDNAAASLHQNPYYSENSNAGNMPTFTNRQEI